MNDPVTPASSDLAKLVHSGGPGKKFKRNALIGGGVLLALFAGWIALRPSTAARVGPAFATEPLARGNLGLTITATGNLEPTNQVTVGSELSGLVQAVLVDVNDRVTKGQPLAQLDTTKIKQQIESSRAAVAAAKAGVVQSEASLKEKLAALARVEELRRVSGGRIPAQADVDTATSAADSARAEVLSQQAAVSQAIAQLNIYENDLSKSLIKSPVDGIVLTRSVELGQTVAASLNAPELFVIAEKLERMKLTITIAEADIGRVVNGLNATFTVDAWPDRVYSAKVQRVSYGSTVTNNVVTYETELDVANDDLSLRPGMTATADIRVAESQGVLLVPAAALRFTPASTAAPTAAKKSFLQSIMPMPPRQTGAKPAATEKMPAGSGRLWILRDGRPEPVTVKTGLSDGRHTEVSGEGLTENAPVILRANPVSS